MSSICKHQGNVSQNFSERFLKILQCIAIFKGFVHTISYNSIKKNTIKYYLTLGSMVISKRQEIIHFGKVVKKEEILIQRMRVLEL